MLGKTLEDKMAKVTLKKKTYCVVCPTWEIKRPEQCSNTIKNSKKTLYFCTKKCKERYTKSPEKFS